jgi:hypothetical protein
MTSEDTLDLYEIGVGEDQEQTVGVVNHRKVKTQSGTPLAEAIARFELSLFLLRALKEPMHLARCDMIIATRRIKRLIKGRRPIGGYWHSLQVIWCEMSGFCSVYWLFVVRAFRATRAALSLIFLHR